MSRRPMDARSEAEKAFKAATTKPLEKPAVKAPVSIPGAREMVSLHIDSDVLEFFQADGPGWAQFPDGRYWRLDVPPSVYHALTAGDACGVLWRGTAILGALDWEAREQDPNAAAYRVDPEVAGAHISALEGEVTSTATGKPALLGRVEADPDDEWWLVVVD